MEGARGAAAGVAGQLTEVVSLAVVTAVRAGAVVVGELPGIGDACQPRVEAEGEIPGQIDGVGQGWRLSEVPRWQ